MTDIAQVTIVSSCETFTFPV